MLYLNVVMGDRERKLKLVEGKTLNIDREDYAVNISEREGRMER